MEFTVELKDVIGYSRAEAIRFGNNFIGIEHMMLAIIRAGVKSTAYQAILNNSFHKGNVSELGKSIEELISERYISYQEMGSNLPLTKVLERALKMAVSEAELNGSKVDSFYVLLSILKVLDEREFFFRKDPVLSELLKAYGITVHNLEKLSARNHEARLSKDI